MDSFISWIGGKKLLRKKILEQFPVDYSRYKVNFSCLTMIAQKSGNYIRGTS